MRRLAFSHTKGENMKAIASKNVSYVISPQGTPLTRADLPNQSNMRWTTQRKAIVVLAVEGGLIALDEACSLYSISIDEYLTWRYRFEHFGLLGLRSSKEHYYRYARAIASTIRTALQHNQW